MKLKPHMRLRGCWRKKADWITAGNIYIYIYSYNKSEDCDGIIGSFLFFWLSSCSLDLCLISNGACVLSSTVQILKDHCVETCEGREHHGFVISLSD